MYRPSALKHEMQGEKSDLRRAIELLSSLIAISHFVKTFRVKWQIIRDRLDQLSDDLVAAENCNPLRDSPVFNLVADIISTAQECSDLAERCMSHSYHSKLLMQSNLDVVAAKFDRVIKILAGMYSNGVLVDVSFAIIVSKPGSGACREDMKFYINDLLTRLKIGNLEVKREGLITLSEILREDERYIQVIVETEDLISVLLKFMESSDSTIQEEAVAVILSISRFSSYNNVLVNNGIVTSLVRVLETGSDAGKRRAVKILQKLTENSENVWSISSQGGVTALLDIIDNSNDRNSICSACSVIKNLAATDEIRRFMIENGVIHVSLRALGRKDESVHMSVIEFLESIASENEDVCQTIFKLGGVEDVLQVLDPKSSFSLKTREVALRAIEKFCFSSSNRLNIPRRPEFLDWILSYIRNSETSIQENALRVALLLSTQSDDTKKAMGELGFMPELVKLLNAKSSEIREKAAETLTNIVSISQNRRKFVQEDQNVDKILQVLDSYSEKSSKKKFLLGTLMLLTTSSSGRRKIASSDYLKHLERLAEAEVADAKKIVRKLSTNRIRNMFNVIWSSQQNFSQKS